MGDWPGTAQAPDALRADPARRPRRRSALVEPWVGLAQPLATMPGARTRRCRPAGRLGLRPRAPPRAKVPGCAPVASATAFTPPRPSSAASVPSSSRRCRSSRCGRNTAYRQAKDSATRPLSARHSRSAARRPPLRLFSRSPGKGERHLGAHRHYSVRGRAGTTSDLAPGTTVSHGATTGRTGRRSTARKDTWPPGRGDCRPEDRDLWLTSSDPLTKARPAPAS